MLPVQMRKRYGGLPVPQEILAAASSTIPAMNVQPLHLISRKAERRMVSLNSPEIIYLFYNEFVAVIRRMIVHGK